MLAFPTFLKVYFYIVQGIKNMSTHVLKSIYTYYVSILCIHTCIYSINIFGGQFPNKYNTYEIFFKKLDLNKQLSF